MTVTTSEPISAFLVANAFVDSDEPTIAAFTRQQLAGRNAIEATRRVFHFVRDEISHSWDVRGRRVTRSASNALDPARRR